MLELLCKIPENVGWMLVGMATTAVIIMGWKVGKLIYDSIKERLEDDECEE